jgi:hypothetical protein
MFTGISFAQEVEKGMTIKSQNYYSFSIKTALITEELISKTSSEGQLNPKFAILPSEAPCVDCYELIDDRTKFNN